jgi:hypothetical protein
LFCQRERLRFKAHQPSKSGALARYALQIVANFDQVAACAARDLDFSNVIRVARFQLGKYGFCVESALLIRLCLRFIERLAKRLHLFAISRDGVLSHGLNALAAPSGHFSASPSFQIGWQSDIGHAAKIAQQGGISSLVAVIWLVPDKKIERVVEKR